MDSDGDSGPPTVGRYPVAGLLRRVRQLAGLSQRQLARRAGVSPSTVARAEAGTMTPSLAALAEMLAAAACWLVVVDNDGHVLAPTDELESLRDFYGRHYPAHLELITGEQIDREWWEYRYGRLRPPATYRFPERHPHHPMPRAAPGQPDGEGEKPPYGPWPVGFRRRRRRRPR